MFKSRRLLVLMSILAVDGANILFLSFPLYSHIRGSLNVANELVSRGHVVWNALPSKLANDKRLQVSGVRPLIYRSLDNHDVEQEFVDKIIDEFFISGRYYVPFSEIRNICDRILRDIDLLADAKKVNIDLMILSSIPLARMLTIFAYKLDVPFIFIGPTFNPYSSRTPFVLSTYPVPIFPWIPNMDFISRLFSSIIVPLFTLYDPLCYYQSVAVYAPERPYLSMEALTAKGLLWLVEMEPLLDYPQDVLPNVKFIGSLSATSSHSLPRVYQTLMDGAEDGVVIVSFGSNVKKIPKEITDRLIKAFSLTRYKYIFKSGKKFGVSSNILLTDWMPQADLLAHPKTKLFITHCGANGQNEAFLNGVPMLGFPMFAEQFFNAQKVVYKGFGLKLELLSFSVEELVSNINEVLLNVSYSNRIKKAAEISKLRDRTPKAEAAYWIEHVIKYGGDHLRSYCQDMPLYQYLNIDVIIFLFVILHLAVYLIWKLCFKCCGLCVRQLKIKKE